MKDKKFIFTSILVSVFLLTVGLTYAYFSLTVSGNDVAETINVNTTKIELIYTDGNEIKVDSIEPKWTTTKTITVENTGNEEAYYALGWQKLYNEIQKDELVIRSTCTSTGVTGGTCDNTDNVVVPQTSEVTAGINKVINPYKENVLILPGETHTYTVTIEFINYDDKAQNYNQGKRFYGVLGAAESTKKLTISDVCQNTTFASCLKDNYELAGLTEIDQSATGNQSYATSEYRYQGKTPNNYITFNGETGVWRIIGVFEVETPQSEGTYSKENKVKIVRDSIGEVSFDYKSSSSYNNDWTASTLMTMLNTGPYYNRTSAYTKLACSTGYDTTTSETAICNYESNGLTDNAKNQISSTKWYLGNVEYNSGFGNTKEIYAQERSVTVHSGNSQTWNGKIGLVYSSDYMYASSLCYNDSAKIAFDYNSCEWNAKCDTDYRSETCKSTNWLLDTNNFFWTMSSSSTSLTDAMFVSEAGDVTMGAVTFVTAGLRPSLYLSSDATYISGSGTLSDPFEIN